MTSSRSRAPGKGVKRPPPERRARVRLETDARRAQLLHLAEEAFAARPYDDVSIDDLAQAAGVSRGLLYHYFPTKRELFLATLRTASAELLSATLAVPLEAPPLARIRGGVDAFLAFVSRRAAAYTAILSGGLGGDAEVARVLEDIRVTYLQHMLQGAALSPLPVPASSPLLRLALRGWIGCVEAASLDWVRNGGVSAERLRDLLVDLLFRSLEAAAGRSLTGGW